MTIEELVKLAKTYQDTILSNNLKKSEAVMLLSLIEAMVMEKIYSSIPQNQQTEEVIEDIKQVEPVKLQPKSIKYDRDYDPAPPIEPEKPPPLMDNARLLVKASTPCICDGCKKILYVTNRDINLPLKMEAFIQSYTPYNGMVPLPNKLEIDRSGGDLRINCPSCKGNFSLSLLGKSRREIEI